MVMRTIHKYLLPLQLQHADVAILMPFQAKILTVQMQNDSLVLWAEIVTSAKPYVTRRFAVYGTGWTLPEYPWGGGASDDCYIGTVQNGSYAWHVYEVL